MRASVESGWLVIEAESDGETGVLKDWYESHIDDVCHMQLAIKYYQEEAVEFELV